MAGSPARCALARRQGGIYKAVADGTADNIVIVVLDPRWVQIGVQREDRHLHDFLERVLGRAALGCDNHDRLAHLRILEAIFADDARQASRPAHVDLPILSVIARRVEDDSERPHLIASVNEHVARDMLLAFHLTAATAHEQRMDVRGRP
eukprot:7378489-Prymnesium_polylepis.1